MFRFLRIHTTPTEEEGSTWLQLFFDLVYVAILVELGNNLADDLTLGGVVEFLLLFIPICGHGWNLSITAVVIPSTILASAS